MTYEPKPFMVWHTVGFQPALPGWRAVFLGTGGRSVEPVAGWLTQHHRLYDPETDRLIPDDEPAEQRIIAGVCTNELDLSVEPAEGGSGVPGELWVILGPGQDEPDQAQHVPVGHPLLLPRENGRPLDRHAVTRMISKAGAAGLPDIHPHQLRPTLAAQHDDATAKNQTGRQQLFAKLLTQIDTTQAS